VDELYGDKLQPFDESFADFMTPPESSAIPISDKLYLVNIYHCSVGMAIYKGCNVPHFSDCAAKVLKILAWIHRNETFWMDSANNLSLGALL
jgi:hypothetical protein